jgi:hypothetical protein
MKIVINTCYGGFCLSETAFEKLVEYGMPVHSYTREERDADGVYISKPGNTGEVIFDRTLTPDLPFCSALYIRILGRYWSPWLEQHRDWPLLIRVIEELGPEVCSGRDSELKIVEIPEGIDWEIYEDHGIEVVAQKHKTWS